MPSTSRDPLGWALLINSRYQVGIKRTENVEPFGRIVEITIKRRDKEPIVSWRDMQRIKNDLFAPDVTMIQVFPPEKHLVDTSNQYYFFVLLEYELPFGFKERLISERTGIKPAITNSATVQEPFEVHQLPEDMPAEQENFDRRLAELERNGWLESNGKGGK